MNSPFWPMASSNAYRNVERPVYGSCPTGVGGECGRVHNHHLRMGDAEDALCRHLERGTYIDDRHRGVARKALDLPSKSCAQPCCPTYPSIADTSGRFPVSASERKMLAPHAAAVVLVL